MAKSVFDNGGIIGKTNNPTFGVASGVWNLNAQYDAKKDGIWPPFLLLEYLLVGGGGGPGGYDSTNIPGTGASGGGVTGSFSMSSTDSLFFSVGGGGTQGTDSAASAAGGAGGTSTSNKFRGGTGGNAGSSGTSGGGGGGGAGTAILLTNIDGDIIAVAGGGAGGGGANEGNQDNNISGGGGNQPNGANGTNLTGSNGGDFTGDGGGGGGGGGGRYGGAGGPANSSTASSGGNNYNNLDLTFSTSTFTGTAGLGKTTTRPAATTITNAANWGYTNNAGQAGAGNTNGDAGIAIIRYFGPQRLTGGTVSTVGGYTVHTFTSDGTLTTL